jgi:hypothetical protein
MKNLGLGASIEPFQTVAASAVQHASYLHAHARSPKLVPVEDTVCKNIILSCSDLLAPKLVVENSPVFHTWIVALIPS